MEFWGERAARKVLRRRVTARNGGYLMPSGLAFTGLSAPTVAMLAALGTGVLIVVYLLRRQRRRIVVPFLPLWLPSAGETRSERFAARFRRWTSFALQLTIFLLVLLAAANVQRVDGDGTGRTVVILMDRSASMQARDEPPSRLERAQRLAGEVIDGLGPHDDALIAAFGKEVTALSGMERDHERLKAALAAVHKSDEPGDVAAALSFARQRLGGGHPRPMVVLISDGAGADFVDNPAFAALGNIEFEFLPVGRRRDNLGIVAFSARRLPSDPASAEAVLAIQSFRATPAEITVAVTAGPRQIPVARRRLRLEPEARVVTTLSALAVPDSRLVASIEGAQDDFSLDDRAYAVVPAAPPLNVLVVGPPNLYLDGALLGMGGNVRMQRVAPAVVEASRARWRDFDVTIFDGVTPSPAPLDGAYLYLDPHGPGSPWGDHGTLTDPVVTEVRREHPLMNQVSLSDLNVAMARRLTIGRDDLALASADRQPLIVARSRGASRQVGIAFDPRQSDLPLRAAFPLLLSNALAWLAQQPAPPALAFPTGTTVRLDLPLNKTEVPPRTVELQASDGLRLGAPVVAGTVTVVAQEVGWLTVRSALARRELAVVAVNLASPTESDIGPRSTLDGAPQGTTAAGTSPTPPRSTSRQRWLWAALAALALAICEWGTFHRRLTV